MSWTLRAAALVLTAAALESPLAAQQVLNDSILIGSRQEWVRDVAAPGEDLLLITVRERGANVALAVTGTSLPSSGLQVDSPIDRGGLMAVVLTPQAVARRAGFRIRLSSQEPAGYRGTVEIAVRRLTPASAAAAWLPFMQAGQDYAKVKALRSAASPPDADQLKQLIAGMSKNYAAASVSAQQAGDEQLIAQATFHAAWVAYQELSDYPQTIALARAAQQAMRNAADEYGAFRTRSLGAAALRDAANALKKSAAATALPAEVTVQFSAAVAQFRAVEHFHETSKHRYEQAQAINNIGLTYYLQGRYPEARAHYERAAEIFRSIADSPNEARSIQNAALVQFELGNHRACSSAYAQALASLERADDLQLYGDILNNAALCWYVQGHFDRALSYYEEAFRIQTQLQNELQTARSLHGMGSTYYSMGDRNTALELYSQALARRPAAKDARGRAATLSAMGNIACSAGHYAEAVGNYTQSLALAVAPFTRGRIQLRLARCLILGGRLEEAAGYLSEIERSIARSDGITASLLLLEQGRAEAVRGRWSEARAKLEASVPRLSQYELVEEQSEALVLLAIGASASGANALRYVEQGIRLAEQIRGRSRNPELRATLFAPWRKFHDLKISLLLSSFSAERSPAGIPEEVGRLALQTAEQARFRALEEMLRDSDGAPVSLLAQNRERTQVLTALTEKRVQLAAQLERSGPEDERVKHLLHDIAGLRARLDTITADATPTLRGSQQQAAAPLLNADIPADTAILAYWIGEHDAVAWVLTHETLQTHLLGSAATINAAVMDARAALASTSASPSALEQTLRRLSGHLLAPLLPHLSSKQRWIIIADGALHYLPFAVLPLPGSNLAGIVKHEIAVAPALRLLRPRQPDARQIGSALLLADPVFEPTDERLAGTTLSTLDHAVSSRNTFPRLRQSAAEIERIAQHLSGARIQRLAGFQANREELLRALEAGFDLLHIATHSRIDADFPQLSAILLSRYDAYGRERNPWVHAAELRALQLRNSHVVLSACESALGKRIEGEGLVGLSYALLGGGAAAVLASTWRIADAATAAYMDPFYDSMRARADVSLAAARAARKLLDSRHWSHPRYWASFVAYENEL